MRNIFPSTAAVALLATACASSSESNPVDPEDDSHICETTQGTCYYLAPQSGSGSGTFGDPFGLGDLPRADTEYCTLDSRAFEALHPGDILYFRAGHYQLRSCEGRYHYMGYLRPARSGTPQAPITFSGYPGESVTLTMVSGGQSILGTVSALGAGFDYLRYIGFILDGGDERSLARIYGTGTEVAYNEFRGFNVDWEDNHDGIFIEDAEGIWVHHNMIHGVTGPHPNSSGIKVYDSKDIIVEDNYIYDNTSGVYDKDSGINNTYRRNFFTGNHRYQWYGNNQDQVANPRIYENVIDGEVELHAITNGAELHDNLIRGPTLAGARSGGVWNSHLWNNVVISHGTQVTAYFGYEHSYTSAEPNPHLRYMDYNVYDASPEYDFGRYTNNRSIFTLAQMKGMGFELNSRVATGVYVDEITYTLNPSWQTAGRNGDPVGPDDVATILDLSRYGPAARR
jgi:parallel beta-helix repeat protein